MDEVRGRDKGREGRGGRDEAGWGETEITTECPIA